MVLFWGSKMILIKNQPSYFIYLFLKKNFLQSLALHSSEWFLRMNGFFWFLSKAISQNAYLSQQIAIDMICH